MSYAARPHQPNISESGQDGGILILMAVGIFWIYSAA